MLGRRMEHFCVEVLRELGLFRLENRRLQHHLTGAFQCLKGLIREITPEYSSEPVVIGQKIMGLN